MGGAISWRRRLGNQGTAKPLSSDLIRSMFSHFQIRRICRQMTLTYGLQRSEQSPNR